MKVITEDKYGRKTEWASVKELCETMNKGRGNGSPRRLVHTLSDVCAYDPQGIKVSVPYQNKVKK